MSATDLLQRTVFPLSLTGSDRPVRPHGFLPSVGPANAGAASHPFFEYTRLVATRQIVPGRKGFVRT
jgi:hypothetical protein